MVTHHWLVIQRAKPGISHGKHLTDQHSSYLGNDVCVREFGWGRGITPWYLGLGHLECWLVMDPSHIPSYRALATLCPSTLLLSKVSNNG